MSQENSQATTATHSRRRFLRKTLVGSGVLASAQFVPGIALASGAASSVPDTLLYLEPTEFLILQAAAERIIGTPEKGFPSATEIGVAARADKFLSGADPEVQEQFHLLLTVFNHPIFTFMFDLRFSAFVNMSPTDQDEYLRDWMTSPLAFRRTAFMGLKRLCNSMYYTDSRSWNEIGYDGIFAL